MLRRTGVVVVVLALTACGPRPENDPIYQALLADPPTSIPARHMPKLRGRHVACDVYNEGRSDQYMTCWWPSGKPVSSVYLTYYGPSLLLPPHPSRISVPGGRGVKTFRVNSL
ncbi:hypothetical protein SAMN05444398_10158 [Roseovarius pacificus]|uniref:Uncharacterized protein n=1 Tax=Roseovarius pacificus TaxID=337701 RepID=A0A1M6WL73_9RHOB|nr:hypothetical protein GCM10011315_10530 [Roseovarius pacificus]SHK94354.1 hypothetical protein SAMN05444398_10158 [Roseovarius pacificus]